MSLTEKREKIFKRAEKGGDPSVVKIQKKKPKKPAKPKPY
jgi:hypothetical protein